MGGFIRPKAPAPRPEPRPEPKPIVQPIVETKEEKKKYDDSKRRGRRSTILTSTSGVSEELELAKKTLLGG
jgi:hypothetical protein